MNAISLDQIAQEGFTDVGVTILGNATDSTRFGGLGFTLDEAEKLADMADTRDLGLVCFSGYMKYQDELLRAEPQRAMVTRGEGDALDSDGLPSNWLCPFRPENKAMYQELLSQIVTWPSVREIHLNDEAMLGFSPKKFGCYCEYCCKRFLEQAGTMPPPKPDWANPLWYQWLEFRAESWTALHAEFREAIRKTRPDIKVGIQHNPLPATFAQRAWVTAINLARDARALDLLATDPYHFIHDTLIPYRPQRRILAEATRALVGACVGRETNMYPQAFLPPSRSYPLSRQDGLLAGIVPFALGAHTITPFAYELMKIIPGFFEGFQDAQRLESELETHRPYAFATAICPSNSEVYGHAEEDWGKRYLTQFADLMFHTGMPWRWAWDERLEDEAETIAGPLIVPDAHCLTAKQRDIIRKIGARGDGILWIGNMAVDSWAGHGSCPLPHPFALGQFELALHSPHPVLEKLTRPLMLASHTNWNGPPGMPLGTVEGRTGLVLNENNTQREAWLTGLPAHEYTRKGPLGPSRVATGGVELLRRLLRWVAGRESLVWLEPFPPPNDYGRLRPQDRRDIPTMELLPLVSEHSILAIIFLYAPMGFETCLHVHPLPGSVVKNATDLWSGGDLKGQMRRGEDGTIQIPLRVPATTELMAIRVELE